MLQQLPRAANKWLKECLDQAFRPLLFAGCYLVDSDGYSCLVWKGAEMGRWWLTVGPSGSGTAAPWPHAFMFPALKGRRWPCLEVGGERKCFRVMKKILWPNLWSWTVALGNLNQLSPLQSTVFLCAIHIHTTLSQQTLSLLLYYIVYLFHSLISLFYLLTGCVPESGCIYLSFSQSRSVCAYIYICFCEKTSSGRIRINC